MLTDSYQNLEFAIKQGHFAVKVAMDDHKVYTLRKVRFAFCTKG